jgi:NTE family protein
LEKLIKCIKNDQFIRDQAHPMFFQQLILALSLGVTSCLALGQTTEAAKPPSVVVVLAGGGAKGFAHLAVLRKLEQDRIPIARIVGTSMGAVIGGLYASGLSTDEIERVVGGLDPSKVALDQLNRLELPSRTRAYQQKYPVDLEFGIKNGGPSFARGVSDGQRFLALLQNLTAHVPPQVNFNDLKIPFRAVATRYRDGEMKVFDQGALHLAIRASMAAPAVFAPVEVDGETYVDGGLVANLPIEVALHEGADVIVASFLAGGTEEGKTESANHALAVANRMVDILIRQNEKRNLALLRPQDILVKPQLADIGFADFNRAAEIAQRGQAAVASVEDRWSVLRAVKTQAQDAPALKRLSFDQREKHIVAIEAQGQEDVSASYIQSVMAPLVNQEFTSAETERYIDELYTSGFFDLVSYSLQQQQGHQYKLIVHVREKPYSPHFLKTTLGFSSEVGGMTQFTTGFGYRRPWLTPSGLEFSLDARLGTQSELAARLLQPLSGRWSVETGVSWDRNNLPLYRSSYFPEDHSNIKLAYYSQTTQSWDAKLVYDLDRKVNVKVGLTSSSIRRSLDTTSELETTTGSNTETLRYKGLKTQVQVDQLDSLSFPTRGYFLNASLEQGISGAVYSGARLNAKWAHALGPHIFNVGLNLAQDRVKLDCDTCRAPSQLYLGGFQAMGAYRMGQLVGDQLAHLQGTYMYRMTDGGLFNQRTYIGTVLETGDAWNSGTAMSRRYSGTLFVAVDSKIGDIYLGTPAFACRCPNHGASCGGRDLHGGFVCHGPGLGTNFT